MRIRTILQFALLLMGLSTAIAQEPATNSTGKISITVSNRSEFDLTLHLMEGPIPPPPPGERFHPHSLETVTKTVKSNQVDHLELSPGQYHLESSANNPLMVHLFGYISVTNSEVWIFTAEQNTNRWALRNWQFDIATRPGFQLAKYPERLVSLPQRTPRLPTTTPSPFLSLPQRTMRLPASMQTNGNQ